jgi:hypothetical protein
LNTTKIALEASLKELLKKKPFDKITIADLTEDCGISQLKVLITVQSNTNG